MITITPTTGPLGTPPGSARPDAHRHHAADPALDGTRATWPLAGAVEDADAALARAVARADACGFRTWGARARIERAEVLDRLGRDGAALRAEGEAQAAELGIATGLRPVR